MDEKRAKISQAEWDQMLYAISATSDMFDKLERFIKFDQYNSSSQNYVRGYVQQLKYLNDERKNRPENAVTKLEDFVEESKE